ncbi:MAG: ribonuclease E/G, partial [Rhodospirillales bacterium]|nr:ribonuclease E/G [Rhodospirillales bacterium]
MATKRMLIDAAHPEETRVAVLDGNQLEELDVESAARRQLKGNIYLAKVTRVEPSLQAAFVDYGGNRHGFLAFNEIHPDYYQIPVADREKLLAENAEASATESDDSDDETETENGDSEAKGKDKIVETVGGDDIDEVEAPRRSFWPAKRYKIQEVIKRRQVLLVQVVKEERGNKGAALTTYLSLAGRYCVLMPNTGKGGGISRKIGNGGDRKRLKTIISGFDIPDGMAVIVRTAGADRSKAEIKRDYEYLIKLWTGIRNLTLESSAPALIHEEANIIKRAIRDHYSRDFDEVLVEGDGGYRMAKDLMKLLIPSHAKKVQPYKDPVVPLFNRYHIESQLETMNSTNVQLKSGGYIVINITEALVAVDVNSGRATRGRNIEETALKTNLEAATEVARQLRLRDLAGLIVIDFIDMDVHRNQTVVARRLKEAMRKDRARIQIGQISPFGLLELSRQRLRPSITETISEVCPHCDGSGIRRSTESTALHVLRGVEEEGARNRSSEIEVQVHSQVALYILNHKREALADIESKFGIRVVVGQDDGLIPPEYEINRSDGGKLDVPEESAGARSGRSDSAGDSSDDPQKKKRRRRRTHWPRRTRRPRLRPKRWSKSRTATLRTAGAWTTASSKA